MFKKTNYSQILFQEKTKTLTLSLFKSYLGLLFIKFLALHLKTVKISQKPFITFSELYLQEPHLLKMIIQELFILIIIIKVKIMDFVYFHFISYFYFYSFSYFRLRDRGQCDCHKLSQSYNHILQKNIEDSKTIVITYINNKLVKLYFSLRTYLSELQMVDFILSFFFSFSQSQGLV